MESCYGCDQYNPTGVPELQVFDKIKGFDEEKLNNDYVDFQKVTKRKTQQESQIKLIEGNIDNLKTQLSEL